MFASRFVTKTIIDTSLAPLASTVFAHPELASSTPADQAEVTAPTEIELRFSEALTTQFSGANLVMTGVPGMSGHNPMKVGAEVSTGGDAKTVVITPVQLLMTGVYKVGWRAVSSDTHPMTGSFTFRVK